MIRAIIFTSMFLLSLSVQSASLTLPETLVLDSEVMASKRVIHLRLPDDYQLNHTKRYPVVYQLQSADSFFAAAAAIDNLTASGQMPEVILAGIEHLDKFAELSEGSTRSKLFNQHLIQELKPFIEENYRTAPFSILSGWSIGGGFVISRLLDSGPFNAFFAYSPALSFELGKANYRKRLKGLKTNNQFLVLTLGNEQGEFLKNFKQLTEIESNLSPRFHFVTHQAFDHRGNAFISQLYGLKALFQGWTPSNELTLAGLDALQSHFQNLSQTYGFKVDVPKEILMFSAYSIINQSSAEQLQKGAELVNFTLQNYPETRSEFENMAQFFKQRQQHKKHEMLKLSLQE